MTFAHTEDHLSQIPALQLLITLGYTYLPPKEASKLRQQKRSTVLLEPILKAQLQRLNQITTRGQTHPFTEANIDDAIRRLKDEQFSGGLRTANQAIYDLLTLGTSLEQTIDGNKRSYSLKYIDWKDWQNNVFHVTAEYSVERTRSTDTIRPDVVLFVNGIPFTIIECKKPAETLEQAVSQSIRNQQDDFIPKLFVYSQLVIGTNKNEAKYATIGTSSKFWAVWKEKQFDDADIYQTINTPLSPTVKDTLFTGDFARARPHFDALETAGDRQITAQDRTLYSLCRRDRLLDLAYRFTVFDGGDRKIARYQQFFAVQTLLERVKEIDSEGQRRGGVIWHTQGSGKSLTMVMMAKAIALEPDILNPRVVLVTDRENLDKQIKGTFESCGLAPVRATTGRHLLELVESGTADVITTIINKFTAALNVRSFQDASPNIFILVDESHRSQYGSFHPRMKQVFPNGCYIGFTGTPLMKKEKNTAHKFGGIIDPPYTIRDAVEDGAVVPLRYEGRHSHQEVNQRALDTWFERYSRDLTDEQKADLKKKYSRISNLNKAEQVIHCIAYDISDHYKDTWQNTGFKAQLVAPDKKSALRYHQVLEDIGDVSSAVIISGPDSREGYEDTDTEPDDKVIKFWARMMKRYGSEEKYNEQLINSFNFGDDPEIIIVVDKLLTGFDAPRNAVIYLTRTMREHTLLQAIARVNRLYYNDETKADKQFGYVVDYAGVLEELDNALATYSDWQGFDTHDLEKALQNIDVEVNRLEQVHAVLLDIFKDVANQHDEEAYEQHLADPQRRETFYERLAAFSRTFAIALSSERFLNDTSERDITNYRRDLKRFQSLKVAVKHRYQESVDYRDIDPKIRKLLDQHISASDVVQVIEPIDIFDSEALDQAIAQQRTPGAKADLIATATRRAISIRLEEDPAFYTPFSEMIQRAIDDFQAQRISEQEYLERARSVRASVVNRRSDDVPAAVRGDEDAIAFFGRLKPFFEAHVEDAQRLEQVAASAARAILDLIKAERITDWHKNKDVQKNMEDVIDDYLYDVIRDDYGITFSLTEQDEIIEACLQLAKNRPSLVK